MTGAKEGSVERLAARWARDPEFVRLVRAAYAAKGPKVAYWTQRAARWVGRRKIAPKLAAKASRIASHHIIASDVAGESP